jgi:hypothetical protein
VDAAADNSVPCAGRNRREIKKTLSVLTEIPQSRLLRLTLQLIFDETRGCAPAEA